MTLRFMDGFDHYATAQLLNKWTATAGTTISSSYGRFGQGAGTSNNLRKSFEKLDTWIVGCAIRVTTLDNAKPVLVFMNSDAGWYQCSLYILTTGQLQARRSNDQVLWTSDAALAINTWYYLEAKVYIHDSAGTFEVRLNEQVVIDLSGVDTRSWASSSGADIVCFFGGGGGVIHYDDIYICDTAGTVNNDFLGDCRVECLFPTGAGSSDDFTPSAGDNYQNVNETTPDGDTTYNESETVGHKDLFAYGNLATTAGTVHGVQTCLWAKKDDAGARSLGARVYSNATEGDGASNSLGTSYAYYFDIFETEPSDSLAWEIADVNAAEFGYEVTA